MRDVVLGMWRLIGSQRIGGIPKLVFAEARNFPEIAAFHDREVIARRRPPAVSPGGYRCRHPDGDVAGADAHGLAALDRLPRVLPAVNRESRSIEARLLFAGPPPAAGTEGRLVWRDLRAHLPAETRIVTQGRHALQDGASLK